MLTTKEAILLRVESTYKNDPTPRTELDAILVSDLAESNEGLRMIERANIKPTISTDQSVFGGTLKKITFTAEVKGSGVAGDSPEIGQALRCCGLSEVVIAGTSVSYKPASNDHETCTIYYYQEARLRKITGCIGTVSISAENASYATASFDFTGHDAGFADSTFPSISYDSTVPAPFMDVNFLIDSYGPVINSLTLDLSNTIITTSDVRDAYGFGKVQISKRDPNGTMDPEAQSLGAYNFESRFKSGTRMALDTGEVGKVSGNKWRLTASIALRDISQGERDQIRTDDLSFGCHETTSDDEFTLTFS